MTDIWNEKPKSIEVAEEDVDDYYHASEMDAWLEKLKTYYDVTTNSIQAYEWKEKAEKWDKYLKSIKNSIPHVSLADYEILEDKLEAINKYIEKLKRTAQGKRIYLGRFEVVTISDAILKILEGET